MVNIYLIRNYGDKVLPGTRMKYEEKNSKYYLQLQFIRHGNPNYSGTSPSYLFVDKTSTMRKKSA